MAKEPQKKQRWYQLLAQAYRMTAQHDKALLPLLILTFVAVVGVGVLIGLLIGGGVALGYAIFTGVLFGVLAAMFVLTRRFERTMYAQMEGQLGGSIAVAQSIRNGWQFSEDPVAVDPRGHAVVFHGVGRGGVVLLAEGGAPSRKLVDQTRQRFSKLVPGVAITPLFVGNGDGQISLRDLSKAIRGTKVAQYGRGVGKGLSKNEMAAVTARLRALGSPRLPVPKGVDPLKARADRKGMRGR